MIKKVEKVVVTGAAGQIAYSLLFRIAAGELLGRDQPVSLHLLEIEEAMQALKGVVMELEDCAFPLLKEIVIGTSPYEVFRDAQYVFLVGATPRGPGMERKDLLSENGVKFIEQGKALGQVASKDVLVLTVGNPCNTNCWVAMKNAKGLHPQQFFAMTRLDETRAKSMLAKRAGVAVKDVTNMIIWGNHSALQVPDFTHVIIKNQPIEKVIQEEVWLRTDFMTAVQKRGAAIIALRGKSSAASAADAALESMRSLIFPTQPGFFFSIAQFSAGNKYGIDQDLIFSFPSVTKKKGCIDIVDNLTWSPLIKEKITQSETELKEEREIVQRFI